MKALMEIFTATCGSCGHQVSAMDRDRMKAAMFDHLVAVHSGLEIPNAPPS